MPRRRVVAAREILPDPKFSSQTIAKFMNHVMQDGKKSVAEGIVYGALERVQEKNKVDPVEFFEATLEKVRPMVEVKARRVGGATYQVPMEVRPSRRTALAMRWLVDAAAKRCLMQLKAKVLRSKNVKTCTVWLKRTKPSLITVSKRIKQSLIRRILMRTASRFNIALYPSGGFAGI